MRIRKYNRKNKIRVNSLTILFWYAYFKCDNIRCVIKRNEEIHEITPTEKKYQTISNFKITNRSLWRCHLTNVDVDKFMLIFGFLMTNNTTTATTTTTSTK